jgi:hypothetical protein
MSSKPGLRKIPSDFEKTFISNNSAALTRTHRLIRIEQEKESLFLCICSQIKFDDFRNVRSEKQRDERKQKRERYQMT